VFGVVATRSFEAVLRVDSDFTASVFDHFRIGWPSMLPFLSIGVIAAAATAAVAGLMLLFRKLASHWWLALSRWTGRLNPQVLGLTALLVGVAVWMAVIWSNRDVFAALGDLNQNPGTASIEAISFSAREKHLTLATRSALLSFFLLLVGVAWLRMPSRASARSAFSRTLGWALLSLALLVALGPTVPRRFMFERFRAVEYDGRRALIIGSARDDLLLFDSERRVTIRVRRDASGLRVTEMTRHIFEN
jgi:hypothetical protein